MEAGKHRMFILTPDFQRGSRGCSSNNFTAVLSRVFSRDIKDGQLHDLILLANVVLLALFDGFAFLGPLYSATALRDLTGEHGVFSLNSTDALQSFRHGRSRACKKGSWRFCIIIKQNM